MLAAHTRGREAGGEVAAEAAGGTGGTLMNAPPSCAASFGGEAEREQGSPLALTQRRCWWAAGAGWGHECPPPLGLCVPTWGCWRSRMCAQTPWGAWAPVEVPKAPRWKHTKSPPRHRCQDVVPTGLGSSFPKKPQQLSTISPWARGPCGVSKGFQDGATKSLCGAGTHPMAPQGGGPAARGGHGGGDAG